MPVAFAFTNTGKDPILLLRLEASQMAGAICSWTHPVYGRLDYDEKTGGYHFRPDARIRSVHEFHSGTGWRRWSGTRVRRRRKWISGKRHARGSGTSSSVGAAGR